MDTISFKAKFVNNSIVQARKPNGRYGEKEVSLVKLCHNKADQNSLQDASIKWKAGYLESILIDYFQPTHRKITIYALTEQEGNFKKLQPEKILGLIDVKEDEKYYKIHYLQTRPDCIRSKRNKPFKGIGASLMKSIITLKQDKNIYLNSVKEAIDFYKKFKFEVVQDDIEEPLMLLRKTVR